ncbi:hypothetical protein PVAP13_1NG051708 [Panicum virgatum]|uniref:Uncharacterized protein n=1 Tax=Panicum virgatum TaxID=38727 RepID=A0A8T0WJC9_PANVG|nr:hypothetical protein PVAP13_1NG051708 [Panicum virgatum]
MACRGGSRALLAPPTDAHDAIDPFLEFLASYKIFEEEDEEIKMEEGKEDEPLPICCTGVATDGRVKDVDCTAGRVKDVERVMLPTDGENNGCIPPTL